jgi:NAD(P)-dependent dehydrogenase (short-subunit alcohol dehydrogenase family)
MKKYSPDKSLLVNKVILVTGASDGLGKAAAITFAEYGATVILLARTIKKLEDVYDEIIKRGCPQPAIYPCNLASASPKDFAELADRIDKEFGRLDGILHNAAIIGTLTPIEHYDIRQWYNVLQVNLNSAFMLTRATLGLLKNSEDASILFTEDSVGTRGKAYWGAYSLSKFAISGLRQVLADELEHYTNIRVNSINPGKMRTQLRASIYPAENVAQLPTPDSIMPAYLFLMGADSRGINGSCLQAQELPTEKGSLFKISYEKV